LSGVLPEWRKAAKEHWEHPEHPLLRGKILAKAKTAIPVSVDKEKDAAHRRAYSRAVMNPVVPHTVLTMTFLQNLVAQPLDQEAIRATLRDSVECVQHGDLSAADAMLFAQATTLDTIFIELARRSAANLGQHVNTAEVYMRLALKAQGQCRATLETLAAIKNPPVVYARQANFAAGPQQVNNGVPTRTDKIKNQPNELLEAKHDEVERVDIGTPSKAIGGDPALATVGAINRAAKR
jgi:hypothetical protein